MDNNPIQTAAEQQITFGQTLKFLIPTLVGVLLFLTPINDDGRQTILIGILTDALKSPFTDYLLEIAVSVVCVAALGSGYFVWEKPDWQHTHRSLYAICHATPVWFFIRLVGAVIGLMVYFQLGPDAVWGEATGRTVFIDIGAAVVFIFLVACFMMPFLTDYGFMEFVGALLKRPFAFLFRLPGRSAIDATASFVAAASVGLLITISQYERGFYTARQAASVATNFSVVSVPFSLVMAEIAGLGHVFFTWYLVVMGACLICALITVRIPPLSRMPDTYYPPVGNQVPDVSDASENMFKTGFRQAVSRACTAPGPAAFIKSGWYASLDVIFGVIGPAMAITTIATIVAVYTPVFDILSTPVYYMLEMASVPEARAAAPGFIVGFLDQFMPALMAKDIESELTRFVLAGLSVAQLIYMAEVGVILLRSTLPLSFWDLLRIFLVRTAILFPIFLIAGHMVL